MSIKCPKCYSTVYIKNGYVRDKQRYRCKECRCNFIEGDNRSNYDNKTKNLVIRMYLNNCGFRRIAAILDIPLTTIFSWVKKAGQIVDEMVRTRQEQQEEIEILEMDELFTFVKKSLERTKQAETFSHPYTRIWTAVDRNRFKTVAFKIGDGNKSNFIELAKVIEQTCDKIKYLCTDEYKAYCSYKLAQTHIRNKSETCLVESFNSSLRDMLARLNRRTKRFSKCFD
jgi:transposase-like protein/IS1 family transposase